MLSSLFYPIPLLLAFASQLDTFVVWGVLLFSATLNIYLLRRIKILRSQLNSRQSASNETNTHPDSDTGQLCECGPSTPPQKAQVQLSIAKNQSAEIMALEAELNETICLDDTTLADEELSFDSVEQEQSRRTHLLENVLQSLTGWHQSLVPLLLQNIGWFIGVLCFISGTVFFISYTQGFTKSVTIFFTILSYTLLLAWGGYHLKEKITQAAMSGNVLMAMSFLLVPLNFSAAAQLIANSSGSSQYLIALLLTLVALVTLFYITRIISGVFNRHLLRFFSSVYFFLSAIQLMVPVLYHSQNMMVIMLVQIIIVVVLLFALTGNLAGILKSLFDDGNYLQLFSIGSLIYTAVVSIVHITMVSQVTLILSYYAPMLMLISGALFYIDAQLHDYKSRSALLSWFSIIAYAASFTAIFLSMDSSLSRIITLLSGSLIYVRLMWLYRSLVPLYLVIFILGFLQYDVILSDLPWQWYLLASLPVLGLFSTLLYYLVKSEQQRERRFSITRHLFHCILLTTMSLAVLSQWYSESGYIALTSVTITLLLFGYWLKSERFKLRECLGTTLTAIYSYMLIFFPVFMILITPDSLLVIDIKIILIMLVALCYSFNSFVLLLRLNADNDEEQVIDKAIFINASIIISLLLLFLTGIGFELSIKTGLLLLVIALNFLFLSLSLYNRGLFYGFILIVSMAVLVFKLYLNDLPSTGLLTISVASALFYFIYWLDRKRNAAAEAFKAKTIHQHNPEKILWCYPCNDFAVAKDKDTIEVLKNV